VVSVWTRISRSPYQRILILMLASIGVFGIADGSLWKSLVSPTIAYRPAVLFTFTLLFGWRGFIVSLPVFLAFFGLFWGWRGAVFITPLYLLSHALALYVARSLAGSEPWLSRQRSTLGFLAGAALAPAVPAFLGLPVLRAIGFNVGAGVPAAVDSWLRGTAGILALSPALLIYGSGALREWVGLPPEHKAAESITTRDGLELCVETAVWTAVLWLSVSFKERYDLNVIYLIFLAPLSFALFRGIGFATLMLLTNALSTTTLWEQLHWADVVSVVDLRLLISSYSVAVVVLAIVVEERRHSRGQVAELLAAQAALRASEERFRLAIKATKDAIWDIDLKSGTVTWNETYSMLYGRPESEDSWQFWMNRIHTEDRDRTVDSLKAAIAGSASSWSAEYRFRRADGRWAHIHDRGYITRDGMGIASRVIGAMQDLTNQKIAESNLRESEDRFRRVFEEGPLGIALVGKDYRFLKVNTALCKMLGYDKSELVQMSFVDITCPDDVGEDVRLTEQLFKGEIPNFRMEKRYLKKNGEIIWINLAASTILGPNGEFLHGLGMIEDITEIKRAQEEALLRQKLESLGTLAGGIAHDFNNILGAVQAQAELALNELETDSSCQKELKAIGEVAMRGSEIVRQLMIYSGAESESLVRIDLSTIVDQMLALLSVSVTKHAAMQVDLDRNLPAILASPAQVRQIVMNLITNASDAIGGRDGVIRVSTKHVLLTGDLGPISSGTLPDCHYVQLEVSDTGRGMSRETQARMFDPFFTTKSGGRGLGLAVVQGIARSLGGAIHVTSGAQKGSTFQILLPCVETTAEESGRPTPRLEEYAAVSQNGVILFVEDVDNLRQPVVKMLRRSGFEVFEAADGTAAIDLLRMHGTRIDAIVLDMTMPGASITEIIAEAAHINLEISVILTSAYSQEMIERSLNAPQIRCFIRKPFQFRELLAALQNCLSSASRVRQPE
jgi:PAS domain S-box-containing protein